MTDAIRVLSGPVFVDTSAYFAAANRRDASQEPVAALTRNLVEGRRRLGVTNPGCFQVALGQRYFDVIRKIL